MLVFGSGKPNMQNTKQVSVNQHRRPSFDLSLITEDHGTQRAALGECRTFVVLQAKASETIADALSLNKSKHKYQIGAESTKWHEVRTSKTAL
jgi:predicted phage-related endonuclease